MMTTPIQVVSHSDENVDVDVSYSDKNDEIESDTHTSDESVTIPPSCTDDEE